jgi:predicted component of type VI protein secretion system
MTFGNDPDKADQVLEDNSVEALHATLWREAEGVYHISDEGSTAGTWVNYTPVSKGGMRLEHGDLVHFGRAGFRFVIRDAKRLRKPVQKPEEPFP